MPALSPTALRARRGPKTPPDPWKPIDVFEEKERRLDGTLADIVTVLIAGAECPFSCVFCDLWQHTLDEATPPGAIPQQVDRALERVRVPSPGTGPGAWIKLYNASNWFDERAVPSSDDPVLLEQLAPFERVVVECHPRFVGKRTRAWAEHLGPARLQVALGLETVHPDVFPRLGKATTLDHFASTLSTLHEMRATTRVFVLVGLPWLGLAEAVEQAVVSTRWALEHGVEHVALVPLRGGNGYVDELLARGDVELPTLSAVEDAVARSLDIAQGRGIVTVDLWDLDTDGCTCHPARIARLGEGNLSGELGPHPPCPECSREAR